MDIALGGLPEPASAFCSGGKIDFAGVLDRQDMATFRRCYCAFAPAFDHPRGRHPDIAKKAVEPHFPGADASRKPPQADVLARNHAFDERRPLYRGDDPRTDLTTN